MSSLLCLFICFVSVLRTLFVLAVMLDCFCFCFENLLKVLVVCLFVFVVVLRTCSKSLGSAIVSSTTTRLVEGSIFDTLSLSEEHCLRFYISTISSHVFLFFDTLSLSEEHCLSFYIWARFIVCFFLSIIFDECLTRYCFWKGQLLHGVHRL